MEGVNEYSLNLNEERAKFEIRRWPRAFLATCIGPEIRSSTTTPLTLLLSGLIISTPLAEVQGAITILSVLTRLGSNATAQSAFLAPEQPVSALGTTRQEEEKISRELVVPRLALQIHAY